jgi:hypothetical protein
LTEANIKQIADDMGLQTERLDAFMALATNKIEKMRLRDKPNGFFCHQAGWFCARDIPATGE